MSTAAKQGTTPRLCDADAAAKEWSTLAIDRIQFLERNLLAVQEQNGLLLRWLHVQKENLQKQEAEITALHNAILDIARVAELPPGKVHELLAHKGAATCANSFMTVPMGV